MLSDLTGGRTRGAPQTRVAKLPAKKQTPGHEPGGRSPGPLCVLFYILAPPVPDTIAIGTFPDFVVRIILDVIAVGIAPASLRA